MLTISCEICGKEREIRPCILRQGIGRFCSNSCSARWRNAKRVLRAPPNGNPFVLQEERDLRRFFRRVEVTDTCWFWTGTRRRDGYAFFTLYGKDRQVHRISYETFVGRIETPHLDHLCRVRYCVNPDHLEPVTVRENTRRGISPVAINMAKTTCINGHPFDRIDNRGERVCGACHREASRRYEERHPRRWKI